MDLSMIMAQAITSGLVFVASKLAEEAIVAGFEPAKEWLKARLPPGYKEIPANKKMTAMVRETLKQSGAPVEDEDQFLTWLKRCGLARLQAEDNHALRRQVARSILGFTNPRAEPPEDLMVALAWPRSRKHELSEILANLRSGLATLPEWKDLLNYTNQAAGLNLLQNMLDILGRVDDAFVLTPSGQALRIVVDSKPGMTADQAVQIEAAYRKGLLDEYRMHAVEGLVQVERLVELPLQDIYVDLGLIPHGSEKEQREELELMLIMRDIERLQNERVQVEKRVSNALPENSQIVILGKPGSGKSITLKFISLMLAMGAPGASRLGLPAPYLPLWVRLADYAEKLASNASLALETFLMEYIQSHFPGAPRQDEYLQMALQEGGCMILLDGLDEVGDIGETDIHGQTIRNAVLHEVQRFAKRRCGQVNTNRIIITSRLEGYHQGDLPGFVELEISPLRAPEEIEEFLVRWFTAYIDEVNHHKLSLEAVERKARQEHINDLMPAIMNWDSILRLAVNPLLLTILAIIHQMGKHLPHRRVKLYQVVTKTMVENWRGVQTGKTSQIYHELDTDKIYFLLAALAYWLHENKPGGTMPRIDWQQKIEVLLEEKYQITGAGKLVEHFLRHARRETGLLTERSPDKIGFFHLTLEEYLAAVEIAGQESDNERLAMLEKHWSEPYWQEVILLTAGELDQQNKPKALKTYLLELLNMEAYSADLFGRPVVLAGRALADIGQINSNNPTHQSILHSLKGIMQDLEPINSLTRQKSVTPLLTRAAAADVLDELDWLPQDLYEFARIEPDGSPAVDYPFYLARYPVTNLQYARFLRPENFQDRELWINFPKYDFPQEDGRCPLIGDWGDEAWDWLQGRLAELPAGAPKIIYPSYWNDPRFGISRKGVPVVGVTWYEASAYCRWLERHWSKLEEGQANDWPAPSRVCLPLEPEWELAASGVIPDGRYPWDASGQATTDIGQILQRANVRESQINRTTPVGMYPLGCRQPHGLWDMSGNVWEWQANYADKDHDWLRLRGGAWGYVSYFARAASRYDLNPNLDWSGRRFSGGGLPQLITCVLFPVSCILSPSPRRGRNFFCFLPWHGSCSAQAVKTYRQLYPEVIDFANLYKAYRKARRGKRSKEGVAAFERQQEHELLRLQEALGSQTYRPGAYHSFYIHEPKRRLISAAPFRDRVVHHALCQVIEPIWERRFIHDSYANRVGKGTHRALDRCQEFARRYPYVLQCDVRQFFPSVDHAILYAELARLISDPWTLWLCERILESGQSMLPEDYEMHWFSGDDLWAALRPRGLPIGNLTSQFWANVYLNQFDHFVKRDLKCPAYLRYVDDFLVFGDKKAVLWEQRAEMIDRLAELRLALHENTAQVYPTRTGIPFLGFRVYPTHRRVKYRKVVLFRQRLKELVKLVKADYSCLPDLNASIHGWVNHVRYADTWGLRKAVLGAVRL